MSNYMYSSPTVIDPGARYTAVDPDVKVETHAAGVDPQMEARLGTAMQAAQRTATAETLAAQRADAANRRVAASTLLSADRRMGINARIGGAGGGGGTWGGGGYRRPVGNNVGGGGRGTMGHGGGEPGGSSGGGVGMPGSGGGNQSAPPLYGGKLTPDHDWSAFDRHFHPQQPDSLQGPMPNGDTLDAAHEADRSTPAGLPFRGSTPGEVADFFRSGDVKGAPYLFPGQQPDALPQPANPDGQGQAVALANPPAAPANDVAPAPPPPSNDEGL